MLLLFSATRSALEEQFQLDGVVPASVGDAAAAKSLFLRMLARAESAAQLKALQALLEGVWDSGHAFQAEAQKPVTAQLDALSSLEASRGQADTAGKLGSLPDADTARVGLKVPDLVAALSNEEQLCKQQGSAPGTPPAEESRWATAASQTEAADGWDSMEGMALAGESALPAAESAAAASQVDAADGWDDMEQVGLPSNPLAPAHPLANGSAAASLADVVNGWEAPEDMVLPSNAAGPALFAADSARTASHVDTARSPTQPAAESSTAASLAEDAALPSMMAAPALPAAQSTEGWDSDDDLVLPPKASQGAATMPEQEWQGPTVVSVGVALADRHSAEASAAGTAPAVDGWDTDEGLGLSLGAEDTAKAQDTVTAKAAISEAPRGGEEPVRRPKEGLAEAAVVPSAASSKIRVRQRAKGGVLKLKATKASRAKDAAALAAAASPADAAQSATESHDAAEAGRRSSLGAAQPAGEEAAAVPLHACWAALLRRMLSVPDGALAGHVLMRLEKAGLEGVPLVSATEAGDIVAAAETAGGCLLIQTSAWICLIHPHWHAL